MLINENAKIERIDKMNIALFKKNKKGKWKQAGWFWPTYEKAIEGVLTIDQITFIGDVRAVLHEIKSFRARLDEIANKMLSRVDINVVESLRQEVETLKNENETLKLKDVSQIGHWS